MTTDAEPAAEATSDGDPASPEPIPLLEPADGVPPVVADEDALADAVRRLAAGHGPIAVDAERASGYRYGQRAYLVQLRRAGAGTVLLDPVPFTDLSALQDVLAEPEWILHAASQDLPCLAEIGLRPRSLFDTELAGRLAGYPRVGLGPLVETVLGLRLEKGHGAADWSTRPLPDSWLRYAALDVEVLIELRAALAEVLRDQGKDRWAAEEFAAIAAAGPPAPREDPWRRTSGLHRVRKPRALAIVRELWLARDAIARQRDIAPGRILPDSAIVEAALAAPGSKGALLGTDGFVGRGARRHLDAWYDAITRAQALPDDELPPAALPSDGPPPARAWSDRAPEAARRLAAAKAAVAALADEHGLPVENAMPPDALRRLCWTPPWSDDAHPDEDAATAALTALGARPWQCGLVVRPVCRAIARAAAG